MTCDFTSFSTVFQSYKDNGRVRLISCVQWIVVVIVVLLFYVHGKHLRSCRDGQLT